MPWYQLEDADDPKLDELAEQYNLHPLHIEDARTQARTYFELDLPGPAESLIDDLEKLEVVCH